ncbi:proprotein convertase subtilisin/kexin type 5-like [Pomacea canaliculata]|uniref:proprotein convertase subtilisin/kexin type 5-like n=1 Tax=Pomacea canaliculata TaxID=400727 RepID=UPI000D7303E5|nr:proprotein convertase subtilisin/kexin type 5-like [Pomacea canaliculata]
MFPLRTFLNNIRSVLFVCPAGSEDLGNHTCQPCPRGSYRANSLQDRFLRCTACNTSFTTVTTGSTSSSDCNISYMRNSSTNQCVQCDYSFYQPSRWQDMCFPCNTSYTTNNTGSTNPSDCKSACSPGYMRIAITNQCVLCPYGYYQPLKWQDECISCNTSYTTNNTGSTSTSDCIFVCPAGSEDLGNHTCQPCPRGSYRANSLQDRFLRCTACNTSFTTVTTGSTSSSDCNITACSPGYMRNSSTNQCVQCDYSFYQPSRWQDMCFPCNTSYTTNNTGSTNPSDCKSACSPGYMRIAITNQCVLCPYGYYQPLKWQDECISCNTSYTTNNTGSTSSSDCIFVCPAGSEDLGNHTCQPCPRGSYRANSLQDRFLRCTACNTSFTTVTTGSASSNDCNISYMRNSSTNQCVQCDYSFYQPSRWQDMCFPCNTSYTTNNTGSTNPSDCKFLCPPGNEDLGNQICQPCQQGYFRSNSLADRFRRCTACNATFTTAGIGSTSSDNCNITACSPGYMRNSSTNQCVQCAVGYYQPLKWQDMCLQCNANYTTANTASTSASDCRFYCQPGYEVQTPGVATCSPCSRGKYKTNNGDDKFRACQTCSSGMTTDGTAAWSASFCNIALCKAGQVIMNGSCVPCPANFYQNESQSPSPTPSVPLVHLIGMQIFVKFLSEGYPLLRLIERYQSISTDNSSDNGSAVSAKSHLHDVVHTHHGACTQDVCLSAMCGPGQQYNSTVSQCVACPQGTWNSGNASQQFDPCAPCPATYVTVGEGATSADNCTLSEFCWLNTNTTKPVIQQV